MSSFMEEKDGIMRIVVTPEDSQQDVRIVHAIKNDDLEKVEKLIKKKAAINGHDREKRTALHHAILKNDDKLVRILIEAGSDVDKKDKEGSSSLVTALLVENPSPAIIGQLIQRGARTDQENNRGETAENIAVEKGLHSMLVKAEKKGSGPIIEEATHSIKRDDSSAHDQRKEDLMKDVVKSQVHGPLPKAETSKNAKKDKA